MKVAGKVIVVTGAGNGMGRAISLNLLNKGAKVIGLDINTSHFWERKALVSSERA